MQAKNIAELIQKGIAHLGMEGQGEVQLGQAEGTRLQLLPTVPSSTTSCAAVCRTQFFVFLHLHCSKQDPYLSSLHS